MSPWDGLGGPSDLGCPLTAGEGGAFLTLQQLPSPLPPSAWRGLGWWREAVGGQLLAQVPSVSLLTHSHPQTLPLSPHVRGLRKPSLLHHL